MIFSPVTGYFDTPTGQKIVITTLGKEIAQKRTEEILSLWSLIPQTTTHTPQDLLQEQKGDRLMYAKWKHSLIAFDQDTDKVVGFLIGYERKAEHNNQYPENTLYLNTLSVAENYQGSGIGGNLVDQFRGYYADDFGFYELPGAIKTVTVQTNSADWNKQVINFYQKHDFEIEAIKEYDNRTDVVMRYYLPQDEN